MDGQRLRLTVLLLCAAACGIWVVGDLLGPGIREWSASHTVATAVGLSLVLFGAGSAGYFASSAIRRRRMDDAITATGFAAIVDCLADMDAMLMMAVAEPARVDELRALHLRRENGRRPYRWYRHHDQAMVSPAVGRSGALAAESVAAVSDDCIRMLMAALRGWADLLTRTDAGIEAMAALAAIRIRLAQLQCDPLANCRLILQISVAARYMALVFDRASGTEPFRKHLNTNPPAQELPHGLHWPTEQLSIDQARRAVEHLDSFFAVVFSTDWEGAGHVGERGVLRPSGG